MSLGFVDLTKAYDPVDRSTLVAILRHYEVTHKLADIILICILEPHAELEPVRVFQRSLKSRLESDGCVLSPMLFNCYV